MAQLVYACRQLITVLQILNNSLWLTSLYSMLLASNTSYTIKLRALIGVYNMENNFFEIGQRKIFSNFFVIHNLKKPAFASIQEEILLTNLLYITLQRNRKNGEKRMKKSKWNINPMHTHLLSTHGFIKSPEFILDGLVRQQTPVENKYVVKGVLTFCDFWFQTVIMKCEDHEFRGLFLV